MSVSTVINEAGRAVPVEINGSQAIPFKGIGKHKPFGNKYGPRIPSCSDYPENGNKIVATLEEALLRCGIRDGMTISTHHHLRDGDLVSNSAYLHVLIIRRTATK